MAVDSPKPLEYKQKRVYCKYILAQQSGTVLVRKFRVLHGLDEGHRLQGDRADSLGAAVAKCEE
jgi:hypothetical protein